MRISDWSSDVCSSDLVLFGLENILAPAAEAEHRPAHRFDRDVARQDQQIRPGKIAPVFLLDWPQQAPRLIQIGVRSEEHTSELQSIMRNSYAVFCLKKKRSTLLQPTYR